MLAIVYAADQAKKTPAKMRFTSKQSLLKTKIATTCGSYYYDYQLSKARRSFGDKVLD